MHFKKILFAILKKNIDLPSSCPPAALCGNIGRIRKNKGRNNAIGMNDVGGYGDVTNAIKKKNFEEWEMVADFRWNVKG